MKKDIMDPDVAETPDLPNARKPFKNFIFFFNSKEVEFQHKGWLLVFLSSAVASIGGFLFGYDIGIVSGALLQLREVFQVNCLMQEIIVSSILMGAFLASLFGGSLVDSLGRKVGMLVSSLLFIGGSLLIAFSENVALLLVGRFVVGFGVSLSLTTELAYISEIAPAKYRGLVVTLNEFGITVGFLVAYLVNYAFISVRNGWRYMFGLSAIPAAVLLLCLSFLPNSPYYLVLKGHFEEAKVVLAKIRPTCNPEVIVQEMSIAIKNEKSRSLCSIFGKEDNMRWRMLLGMLLVLFQQFSGNANVLYYAPTIFSEIGFCSDKASTFASVGLGLVKVVAALLSMFILDKFGRRKVILLGCFVMMLSLVTLGVELLLTGSTVHRDCSDDNVGLQGNQTEGDKCPASSTNAATQKSVSIITLMTFVFSYGFSFGAGSWLVLGEIFPISVRGRCISIATSVNWLGNILVSMSFLELFYKLGVGQTFVLYAVVCLLAWFFMFFCLPETKGKSLEEISLQLNNKMQVERAECCKYLGGCCCRKGQRHVSLSELTPIRSQIATIGNDPL